MTTVLFSMLGIALLGFVFCIVMMLRNEVTYRIRMSFINNWDIHLFDRLPSYREMHEHPKHYLRWTRASWLKWLGKQ